MSTQASQPFSDFLGDHLSLSMYGALGDGVANDAPALVSADASVASIGGHLLMPAGVYRINSNLTLSAHVKFSPGAIIKPASGKKVTFAQPITAGMHKIFDYSLGGTVDVSSTRVVMPEWWGAVNDGATNCKPAIDAALAQAASFIGRTVQFQHGHYVYHGMLRLPVLNGTQIIGPSAHQTFIDFTDTSVIAGIITPLAPSGFDDLRIKGITINGPGKTTGSHIHGIYSTGHLAGEPSGLKVSDVRVSNWSGWGCMVQDVFNSHFEDFWAENCGDGGIALGGDQSVTFVNSGQYNANIGANLSDPTGSPDAYSWWFMTGAPSLQGLNTAECANGMRLGSTASDPNNIAYVTAHIVGLNIEGITTIGGNGIVLENGSSIVYGTGITMYAVGFPAGKGIWWKDAMNNPGFLVPPPAIVSGSVTSPVTISIASPAVVSSPAHGIPANSKVVFQTSLGGSLPSGIVAGDTYYILSPLTNSYNISATPGGAAINTSGGQSGSHRANTGSWSNPFYSDGSGFPNHGIVLMIGDDQTDNFNSNIIAQSSIQQILPNKPSSGGPLGFRTATQMIAPGFINTGGQEVTNAKTITVSDTPYTVVPTDRDIDVDASGGDVIVLMPSPGGGPAGRRVTVTKYDASDNQVNISGPNDDLRIPNSSINYRINAGLTKWDNVGESNRPWLRQTYGNGTLAGLPTLTIGDSFLVKSSFCPYYIDDCTTFTVGDPAVGGGAYKVLVIANPTTGNYVVLCPLLY
jgi:hypothetical protein